MGKVVSTGKSFNMPIATQLIHKQLDLIPWDFSTLLIVDEDNKPLKFEKPTGDKWLSLNYSVVGNLVYTHFGVFHKKGNHALYDFSNGYFQ